MKIEYVLLADVARPGDYVIYDVPKKTFTMETKQTGCWNVSQKFDTSTATNMWQVLYNDETYGLEITSSKSVGTLSLGTNKNGEWSVHAYNNAVDTLNSMCENYLDTNYASRARSIGSNPFHPADEVTTYHYAENINKTTAFKNNDTCYTTDFDAMQKATNQISTGILGIDIYYFLASRDARYSSSEICYYELRGVTETGIYKKSTIGCCAYTDGSYGSGAASVISGGVRPVVKLLDGIIVKSGKGTIDEPYIMGIR